ncbi:MAG: acyl-CoA synthetase [Congregibacter sp.]
MPHPSETAREYPRKPAIIMGSSGKMVTYRQLDERSNQIAQLLRARGLRKGDHMALMLENRHEFLEICWGAQRAGVFFTPISNQLLEDETAYILTNCQARLFVVSRAVAGVARAAVTRVSGLEHTLMMDAIEPGFESWEEAIDVCMDTPLEDQGNGMPMLYSSGTTGKPKGILIPVSSEAFDTPHLLAQSLGAAFGFGEETVYLSPAPLYHAAPLHYNMMNLSMGGTSVIMEKFDAENALALIDEHRITHSQWVPIMFVRMLKLPAPVRRKYDVSSMHFAIHAAAPCPIEIKEQMIDWWGPVIVEYYAGSESVGATIITSEQWLQHKGSVGRAFSGEVHIVDEEGRALPPREIGSVYFSGPQAVFEYHNEPEKTANSFNEQGWATLGDIGYLDDEGYLYLTDRKHFMIISGGVNIYPQELENLLITHEKVADVAVFGVPHEEFGEAVKAVVQPQNWVDATDEVAIELLEWLRERLSHIKLPRSIDFSASLPRLDNGKLYKRHLADQYRDLSGGPAQEEVENLPRDTKTDQ